MMETALVFDRDGNTLFWHEPQGRSEVSLPDSRTLWDVLWENRLKGGTGLLLGVAHTHPWRGEARPSQTDLTTFRAVEQGLGQLLVWPIVTFTEVAYYQWFPDYQRYMRLSHSAPVILDLEELRIRSGGEAIGGP